MKEMELIRTLPTYEENSFALWIAKATEKYFENPEVKKRFEEWQKNRQKSAQETTERKNLIKTAG